MNTVINVYQDDEGIFTARFEELEGTGETISEALYDLADQLGENEF